jgi:hypothetical protein
MKRALIIVGVTLALIASVFAQTSINTILDAMNDKPKKDIFKAFHYLHEKDYKLDSEEGIKRYRIFKDNLKWIKTKNAELESEVYGITKFMDLTKEEYQNTLMNSEVFQQHIQSMKSKSQNF